MATTSRASYAAYNLPHAREGGADCMQECVLHVESESGICSCCCCKVAQHWPQLPDVYKEYQCCQIFARLSLQTLRCQNCDERVVGIYSPVQHPQDHGSRCCTDAISRGHHCCCCITFKSPFDNDACINCQRRHGGFALQTIAAGVLAEVESRSETTSSTSSIVLVGEEEPTQSTETASIISQVEEEGSAQSTENASAMTQIKEINVTQDIKDLSTITQQGEQDLAHNAAIPSTTTQVAEEKPIQHSEVARHISEEEKVEIREALQDVKDDEQLKLVRTVTLDADQYLALDEGSLDINALPYELQHKLLCFVCDIYGLPIPPASSSKLNPEAQVQAQAVVTAETADDQPSAPLNTNLKQNSRKRTRVDSSQPTELPVERPTKRARKPTAKASAAAAQASASRSSRSKQTNPKQSDSLKQSSSPMQPTISKTPTKRTKPARPVDIHASTKKQIQDLEKELNSDRRKLGNRLEKQSDLISAYVLEGADNSQQLRVIEEEVEKIAEQIKATEKMIAELRESPREEYFWSYGLWRNHPKFKETGERNKSKAKR